MKTKRKWLAIPGFLTLAAAAAMLSAYAGASSSEGNSPAQPIAFPHTLHAAGNLKMNCVYCHFSATKSPDPGLPAVGTCMGCHTVAAIDRPEVKKLFEPMSTMVKVPEATILEKPKALRT